MAKALLYRGMAYRQQQKPAQAISDITRRAVAEGRPVADRPHQRLAAAGGGLPGSRADGERRAAGPSGRRQRCDPGQGAPRADSQSNWGAATHHLRHGHGVCSRRRANRAGGWQHIRSAVCSAADRRRRSSQPKQEQAVQPKQEVAPFATTVKAAPEPKASRAQGFLHLELGERHRGAQRAGRADAARSRRPPSRPRGPRADSACRWPWCARRTRRWRWRQGQARLRRSAGRARARDRPGGGRQHGLVLPRPRRALRDPERGPGACARLKGSGLDCLVVTQ